MIYLPVVISILLALVPVAIWGGLIRKKTTQERKFLIQVFIGGSLSVVPILLYQRLWEKFSVLDIIGFIEGHVTDPKTAAILVFIFVGIMEEVVKQAVVRITDRRHPEIFLTINGTLTLSVVSALGFAFAENIFYFYSIWVNFGFVDLFSSFVFRSSFTAAGHMIFSGIFGYYFGMAKFASDFTAQERFAGKKFYLTRFFGKIFRLKTYEIYRQQKILQGLFLAMGIHAVFNYLLQMNLVLPVMALIAVSGTYIYYLLHTVSGHLLFSFTQRRTSTMALKDEEVVIELLGLWLNDGKFQEVITICDRLLKRDPDNNVVKLFRAKAADNEKLRNVYESLKQVFGKENLKINGEGELSTLAPENEKVVAEVMDMWFSQGEYKKVIEVANRLLARNPTSEGARLILKKAIGKEKLQKVFHSLKFLFEHSESERS